MFWVKGWGLCFLTIFFIQEQAVIRTKNGDKEWGCMAFFYGHSKKFVDLSNTIFLFLLSSSSTSILGRKKEWEEVISYGVFHLQELFYFLKRDQQVSFELL